MDRLPAELKLNLLCAITDVSTLRNLASAIPSFSSILAAHRRQVLLSVLHNELNTKLAGELNIILAMSDPRAEKLNILPVDEQEEYEQYVKDCIVNRETLASLTTLEEQDIMTLTKLHLRMCKVIEVLGEPSVENQPRIRTVIDSSLSMRASLSSADRLLLYQALCRLELVAALCPASPDKAQMEDFQDRFFREIDEMDLWQKQEELQCSCIEHQVKEFYEKWLRSHAAAFDKHFKPSRCEAENPTRARTDFIAWYERVDNGCGKS